ncbi:MAG TPA: acyl-CoA dehydrogenase family protein [Thermoplasmata archaeon]|nr:acyl-CoA dehydrogenase family protein [Thermoplasmata archaeon]
MRQISYAYGTNHFDRDEDLAAILTAFWRDFPRHRDELHRFGQFAGEDVYETVYHVDQDAAPVLVTHDLDGRRVDRARLSPAERVVLKAAAHINRPPYEGGSWHHHFALGYLLGDPGLYCVLTITNQTVYGIHKYAPAFAAWKEAMLAGDAFGATWMTEIQGGSDLGANITVARRDGDVWRLTGEKYFASGAGLADYALVTARPPGAKVGAKGLALFLLPRLRASGELNFTVRRLKDKSATRAVPTGEVDLNGSEAHLLGTPEDGVYMTLEILNVSRLANAIGAMATAKKAQLEVLERVRRREAFGRKLREHPLIRRDLTDLAVRAAGGLALAFRAVDQFDRVWNERRPYSLAYHYARFLIHLAKNRTAEHAAAMTALAMELFGGLGFLEEYAVARWHREALITPIWEGPSNIQALDFLESIQKHHADQPFLEDVIPRLEAAGGEIPRLARREAEAALESLRVGSPAEVIWRAKHAMTRIADATTVVLLLDLSKTGGPRYERLAELYGRHFLAGEEYPTWALDKERVWDADGM